VQRADPEACRMRQLVELVVYQSEVKEGGTYAPNNKVSFCAGSMSGRDSNSHIELVFLWRVG
jgi:hypothetical protein